MAAWTIAGKSPNQITPVFVRYEPPRGDCALVGFSHHPRRRGKVAPDELAYVISTLFL
jgi:hypothetical protein